MSIQLGRVPLAAPPSSLALRSPAGAVTRSRGSGDLHVPAAGPPSVALSGESARPAPVPARPDVHCVSMTFEEALAAAGRLGAFMRGRVDAFVEAGGPTGNRAAMEEVFGPLLPGNPPDTAVLGIHSIRGEFLYSITAVDLATGHVFQTAPGAIQGFHGPVVPPPDARLVGSFSEAQLLELEMAIREGMRSK